MRLGVTLLWLILCPEAGSFAQTSEDIDNTEILASQGRLLPARSQLLKIFQGLEGASRQDALLQVRVLYQLGCVYIGLDRHKEGLSFFYRASLLAQTLPNSELAKARIQAAIGVAQSKLGDTKGGQTLIEQSLRLYEQQNRKGSVAWCFAMSNLGEIHYRSGRIAEAWGPTDSAYAALRSQLVATDYLLLQIPMNLAVLSQRYGKPIQADLLSQEVLSVVAADPNISPAALAIFYRQRADILKTAGRKDLAKKVDRQAQTLARNGLTDNGAGTSIDIAVLSDRKSQD